MRRLYVHHQKKSDGNCGRKHLSLKETLALARKLEEYEDFYALVWMKEQAREAGLDLAPYLRSPLE